jgi:hypothetical protein
MSSPELSVVSGTLPRNRQPKTTPAQDALAKRWRLGGLAEPEPIPHKDVIPLLDGWIRLLEREAGSAPAASSR